MNIDFESTRMKVASGIVAIVLPSILQEQLIYDSLNNIDPIAVP